MAHTSLTRKQKNFVQLLLDNPKLSATQAALQAYDTEDYATAGAIAHENLQKPQIISALGQVNELVEGALISTVRDWSDSEMPRKREIALDAAKFIHDKVHGKAVQKQEIQTVGVTLSIDLTGALQTKDE